MRVAVCVAVSVAVCLEEEVVETMETGKNLAEPTCECGLRIFRNLSEPTTQRPSPQYRKVETSKMCITFR